MSERKSTTEMLSALVAKRLRARHMFWAPEVDFDKNTPAYRRIDFVGFKPFTPSLVIESCSVELGRFECYEVKSCMADFQSGHGLTFYGDANYLVTTREFADELDGKLMIPNGIDDILMPNKPMTALISRSGQSETQRYRYGSQSYRRRTASEMLWQIMAARHHYDIQEASDE